MSRRRWAGRARAVVGRFVRHEGGANAVEFAIVVLPFITLLIFTLQIGIVIMTKMSLDTGVLRVAESLEKQFASTTTPTTPSGSALKAQVVTSSGDASNGGGLVSDPTALKVEVQPLANLNSGAVTVTDQLANYGLPRTVLAVRATYTPVNFVPGLAGAMTVHASTLVRRGAL